MSASPPNEVVKHHGVVTENEQTRREMMNSAHNQCKRENECLSTMVSRTETFDDELKSQ